MRYLGLAHLLILTTLALVMSLITGFGVASAARETATNVFVGTATTGDPNNRQSFPVVFTGETLAGSDGTIGWRYFYRAVGKATGSVPGEFEYLEYGYIFFHADGSFAANRLESQKIILYPYGGGAPVTIVDTNPMAYTFEFASAPVKLSALPRGAMRSLGQIINPKTGFLPKGGSLTYGYFTFTINDREFVGYATPDFRQFSIEITFDVAR